VKRTKTVTFRCNYCKGEASFEAEEQPLRYGRDDAPRPRVYVVKCPHCDKENRVEVDEP